MSDLLAPFAPLLDPVRCLPLVMRLADAIRAGVSGRAADAVRRGLLAGLADVYWQAREDTPGERP